MSIGSKEKACKELIRTTLNLWNSLGMDKDMVKKILYDELKDSELIDIFINDIRTVHPMHCCYIKGKEIKERVITGYEVSFILNDIIDCKIVVMPEYYDGSREHLIKHIKGKINHKIGSE